MRGNRFSDLPLEDHVVEAILDAAISAPSVGYSQPWRFVLVRDADTRRRIKSSFEEENEKGAARFSGERETQYRSLKLEGIDEAPLNIAVFYQPSESPVLGQTTMQQSGVFSVVCAIQNMWLMARALNVGLGWVSIVAPETIKQILNAPEESELVGYLCLGYVDEFLQKPELESMGWESRKHLDEVVFDESF